MNFMRRVFSSSAAAASPYWFDLDYNLSQNPDHAFALLKPKQPFLEVPLSDPASPKPANHTRFVLISDTHTATNNVKVPPGDVLIHAGDFSNIGLPGDIEGFAGFLDRQPHAHKVVIAGNHDLTFHTEEYPVLAQRFRHKTVFDSVAIKNMLREHCIYLEDSECNVLGFRIYGSPWQPEFCDWAFNLPRGEPCETVWRKIPEGVDIVVTHGPPLGRGDLLVSGDRSGCRDLLWHIQHRVKPKLHVFGHIHEAYGVSSDGTTIYANASTCNFHYAPNNPPMVIDLPNK